MSYTDNVPSPEEPAFGAEANGSQFQVSFYTATKMLTAAAACGRDDGNTE